MARSFGIFAAAAAAAFGAAHGSIMDTLVGKAPGLDAPTGKTIAGVPVLNYDSAYKRKGAPSAGMDAATLTEDWIVVLTPQATEAQIQDICEHSKAGCSHRGSPNSFAFVALRGSEDDLEAAITAHSSLARYIEVDSVVSKGPLPEVQDTPVHSAQSTPLWGLERIGANKRSHTGRGIHVYVADTGVRVDHVDFGGRAVPFIDLFDADTDGTMLCANSTTSTCAGDVSGHGTHCAGTVAGTTYGVAPDAMIYAVKVLSDQGSGSNAGILMALSLIAEHHTAPAITSMSLGGSRSGEAMGNAIDSLTGEAGVTVVVAAGNEYTDACTKSPAYVPSAITVGSTALADVRSGFSNFGTCVDIWAPGSDIISAYPTENNATASLSGTSMACPHVSGGAALILEANPTFTPVQVRAKLYEDASVNYISDLSPADRNDFLYVGNDGPEAPQPNKSTDSWPPPEFFESCTNVGQAGPLGDYPVCMCADRAYDRGPNATRCFKGYEAGCPIGALAELGAHLANFYFLTTCADCNCYAPGEEPMAPAIPPPNNIAVYAMGALLIVLGVAAAYCYFTNKDSMSASGGDVEIAQA